MDEAKLKTLWADQRHTLGQICYRLGRRTEADVLAAAKRLGLPERLGPRHDRQPDDPTPEEIAERAAEVRSWWDEKTRAMRSVAKPPRPVEAPQHWWGKWGWDT
jgi:hypothetical protein